ncbi:MAG: hypothetical protein ABSB09_01675 [Acidimicrobiales bacterium]|jgi:hypothetical protein
MEIMVDLAEGRVWLEGWDDFGSLSVSARTGRPGGVDQRALDALADALAADGSGRIEDDDDVRVPPDALRALALRAAEEDGHAPGPEWEDEFAAMLESAADSGWIDDDGAVRAHVEWRDA